MNYLGFSRDALEIGKVSDMVSAECCGALSVFVGTTRDSFEGKKVMSLEYEAYEPMALKQLECVCEELRLQWPDIVNIAIYHRLGLVGIREASVMIAISSPHRETSLKAVAVAIEDLKKRVPIWKKEIYIEGQATWKENKESSVSCNDALHLFNECTCQVEDSRLLPSQLVQISASEDEIERRIRCFVEKKRKEIDLYNVVDFIDKAENGTNITYGERQIDKNESITCARVNSFIVKQEFSKCHLKVRRVKNNTGPQTCPDYLSTLDKLLLPNEKIKVESHLIFPKNGSSDASNILQFPLIEERLKNIEEYINVPQSDTKNIYQRIKVIENRLLYLESISPEYSGFLIEKFRVTNPNDALLVNNKIQETLLSTYRRKLYSIGELGTIIQAYEKSNPDLLYCDKMK